MIASTQVPFSSMDFSSSIIAFCHCSFSVPFRTFSIVAGSSKAVVVKWSKHRSVLHSPVDLPNICSGVECSSSLFSFPAPCLSATSVNELFTYSSSASLGESTETSCSSSSLSPANPSYLNLSPSSTVGSCTSSLLTQTTPVQFSMENTLSSKMQCRLVWTVRSLSIITQYFRSDSDLNRIYKRSFASGLFLVLCWTLVHTFQLKALIYATVGFTPVNNPSGFFNVPLRPRDCAHCTPRTNILPASSQGHPNVATPFLQRSWLLHPFVLHIHSFRECSL